MKHGIVLLSFGNDAYAHFAWNMAMSIKAASSIPIHLVASQKHLSFLNDRQCFDYITELDQADYLHGGVFAPAKAKLSLYKYLIFDENIYLDVDGICLKDICPLFDECKDGDYFSQVVGWGRHGVRDFKEMVWAWGDQIYDHFAIPQDARIPFINSSFQFIRLSDQAKGLYSQAMRNFINAIPIKDLRFTWGKSQPDELYMNVALAQTGIDPTLKNPYPVYFNYRQIDPEQDIVRDHYVLGLYGDHNFTHRTVVDYYDRKMNQILRTNFNMSIRHKANSLMKRKFTITRSA